MNEKEETWWSDEGDRITRRYSTCSCGGELTFVGSAGCDHGCWASFVQCRECKNLFDIGMNKLESVSVAQLERAGFKLKKKA